MMRIVAMRADVHQAVGGLPVRQLPAVLRPQARNGRIHRQQLVHQLTGALNEHRLAPLRRRLVLVGAAHEQALVVSPANPVARCLRVLQRHASVTELLAHRRRHRLGHHEIALATLEVAAQRLELRRGAAGGDDDGAAPERRHRRATISTSLRSRRDLLTRERSKIRAPRLTAARARPRQAR